MTDWKAMYHEAEAERDALQINHERLTRACVAILGNMPTGSEPAGQDMDTTMRQHRVREWRTATMVSARDLGLGGEPTLGEMRRELDTAVDRIGGEPVREENGD